MRATFITFGLAAGLALICCQNASALPAAPGAIGQSASGAAGVEHTQYAERHGRRGITKCYRELIIGNYVCHHYRGW